MTIAETDNRVDMEEEVRDEKMRKNINDGYGNSSRKRTEDRQSERDHQKRRQSCRDVADGEMWRSSSLYDVAEVLSQPPSFQLDAVEERIKGMRLREMTNYRYNAYCKDMVDEVEDVSMDGRPTADIRRNSFWREKICHWSYSVVDHFDLSREVVAVSLSLFDRYMATQSNRCTSGTALLASLATLHTAIKVHESRKIRLSTLASLSRGQFGPRHVEEMERRILSSLSWYVHPPTVMAFIAHLFLFLPSASEDPHYGLSDLVRADLLEVCRYLSELAVCDSFFIEYDASVIAFACILNVLDDTSAERVSFHVRERFQQHVAQVLQLHPASRAVSEARERLQSMFAVSTATYGSHHTNNHEQQQQQQRQEIPTHSSPSRERQQPVSSDVVSSVSDVSDDDTSVANIRVQGVATRDDAPTRQASDSRSRPPATSQLDAGNSRKTTHTAPLSSSTSSSTRRIRAVVSLSPSTRRRRFCGVGGNKTVVTPWGRSHHIARNSMQQNALPPSGAPSSRGVSNKMTRNANSSFAPTENETSMSMHQNFEDDDTSIEVSHSGMVGLASF